MLQPDKLKKQLLDSFDSILPSAFEEAYKATMQLETDKGNELAKTFANTLKDLINENLAEAMANAIDYYIRQVQIDGKCLLYGVVTAGSPVTQTQSAPLPLTITTLPVGMGGGVIPNINTFTLGVS